MNTNKSILRLPKELQDLVQVQNSHHEATKQNISVQWREYFVAEIQDDLKPKEDPKAKDDPNRKVDKSNQHNFYESNLEEYNKSDLKKIIQRFELLLHSYMREFV